MSFSSTTARSQYTANGSQVDFVIQFPFQADADIGVIVTTSGVDATMTLNTDYTVSGEGTTGGGNVRFTSAPASGTTVTIFRDLDLNQTRSFAYNGSFPTPTVTAAADKAMQAAQQINEKLKRSLRIPVSNAEIDELALNDRKSKTVTFDEDGNLLLQTTVDVSGGIGDEGIGHDQISAAFRTRMAATIAAAKAVSYSSSITNERVEVLGYYAAGDGGGGLLYVDKADTTTADNGVTVYVASDGTRLKRVFTSVINVKWAGAKGDLSTDDTASIQASIDYCESLRGAGDDALRYFEIYFPPGVYRITATLTVNKSRISFRGAGQQTSVITRTGDFGDSLHFIPTVTGGTNGIGTAYIAELGFYADTEPTSGAAIRLRDARYMEIRSVNIENTFGGILQEGGGTISLSKLEINIGRNFTTARTGSYGYKTEASVHDFPYPGFIAEQVNIQGWNTYAGQGWWLTSADGCWVSNSHVGGFLYNTYIYGPNLGNCSGVFMQQVYHDGFFSGNPTLENIRIENQGTCVMQTYMFSNCEISGASYLSASPHRGSNIRVRGLVSSIQFTGCHIAYAGGIGIWLNTGLPVSVLFSDCSIRRNSLTSSNNEILVESCAGARISNCVIGESGYASVATGAFLAQSNAGNLSMDGCSFFGFGAAPILDTTTAGTNRYTNITTDNESAVYSIASAATLEMRSNGSFFNVTGTTNISNVSGTAWYQRSVTLCFAASLTVSNGANLAIVGGTFGATADDTLTIAYNGTKWVEVSRSVN